MNQRSVLLVLIIVGIIFIIIAFVMIYSELNSGKKFCNSINGEWKLKFLNFGFNQFCNQQRIFQYTDGWDFLRPDPTEKIKVNIP